MRSMQYVLTVQGFIIIGRWLSYVYDDGRHAWGYTTSVVSVFYVLDLYNRARVIYSQYV